MISIAILMVMRLQFDNIDKKFYLLIFQMEKFHYNMRCTTKDHLILEDIYSQCDSDCYISMNPKLANVTLGCIICIFGVSITYFIGENRIRIWRNTYLVSILIGIWLYENSSCKLLLCYENLSIPLWTKYKESVKEF